MSTAIAVTADGAVFRGRGVGADGVAVGEVVFNTAMAGYQEILTDPSYAGQVVVLTASHVGNYGTTPADDQAAGPHARGLIIRALARRHSNWRAEGSLAAWLREHGLVALADVDTRALTRHVRDHGAQPIAIGTDVDEAELRRLAADAPRMEGQDLATGVGTTQPYRVGATVERRGLVAALDLGLKRDITTQLAARGWDVEVLPPTATADDVRALAPDGFFISNGPGDPEPLEGPIATVRALLGEVPTFGICLGHQVLGLALGGTTFKLPFGHHGGNHPVRRIADGTVAITAQNHGFAVDPASFGVPMPPAPEGGNPWDRPFPDHLETVVGRAVATHQNLNDGTLEGLACLEVPAFGVQYHPEAAPGPHDAVGLFDDFTRLIEEAADARA
ncbi:MAG: glutamine-hydrolyzing carbamoyl-phosphate synthase small subunit [Acidimicrobiia bacterium]